MKRLLLVLLPLFLVTACASSGTPVEEPSSHHPRKDKLTSVYKLNVGSIFGGSSKKEKNEVEELKAENDELRAEIEKLKENNTSGTAAVAATPANNATLNSGSTDSNSVSYREWLNAREQGSTEYQEFTEYQQWLEFEKQKKQSKN